MSASKDTKERMPTVPSTVEVSVDISLLLRIDDRQEQGHELSRTLTPNATSVGFISSRGCLPEDRRML